MKEPNKIYTIDIIKFLKQFYFDIVSYIYFDNSNNFEFKKGDK